MKTIRTITLTLFLLTTLSLTFPNNTYANLSCEVAHISNGDIEGVSDSPDKLDINYCVTSPNRNDLLKITAIEAVCRLGPLGIINASCHPDPPLGIPDPFPPAGKGRPRAVNVGSDSQPIGFNERTGKYFTCFNILDLDRNMGAIDISLLDESGNEICGTTSVYVTPGDYSFFEYFARSLGRIIDIPDRGPRYHCAEGQHIINTALGCISTDIVSGQFLIDSYKRLTPMSGAAALLLILTGIFLIITSSDDPQKLAVGKGIITSTITGLIFIILAIYLMNLIGFRILQLPGL